MNHLQPSLAGLLHPSRGDNKSTIEVRVSFLVGISKTSIKQGYQSLTMCVFVMCRRRFEAICFVFRALLKSLQKGHLYAQGAII